VKNALLISGLLTITASPSFGGTAVALSHSGDDGLSTKVAEAIATAFQSSGFTSSDADAAVRVVAPSENVGWRSIRGRTQVDLTYEVSAKDRVHTYHASCPETALTRCVEAVLTTTRRVAGRQ
jgi:hypothetical protein